MTGAGLANRCAWVLRSALAAAIPVLAFAAGVARAETVTPWGVARTILPDAPASADPVGPPVMPAMPGGGIGAVKGPGLAPRQSGFTQPSAQTPALPRPRLSEHPSEQVPPELNPLAERLPTLKAVRERPLFLPSRRPQKPAPAPVAQAAVPVAPPPPSAPTLRLVGIIQDPENAAGLVRRGSGPTLVLRTGDPIDGWSVSEIGPEHLTIRLGDQVQTYRLFAATTPPGMRPRPMPRQGER
jgi:hypothetical protein